MESSLESSLPVFAIERSLPVYTIEGSLPEIISRFTIEQSRGALTWLSSLSLLRGIDVGP